MTKSDTVSLFDLQHLSPRAIYALASGKYDDEVVELVLSAAATAQRHLNETDVSDIAKRGAMAAILKEIEADQKAEAEAQAAQDARRAEWEAQQAEAERERAEAEAILDGGPDPRLPQAPEPIEASSEAFHVRLAAIAASDEGLTAFRSEGRLRQSLHWRTGMDAISSRRTWHIGI